MRYFKKQMSLSLAILLIFSLALGSIAMAEGDNSGSPSGEEPSTENSCQTYSSDREHITASHANIVDNGNGTATATFTTTQDCVRVSFSSYAGPADWKPGPGETTIPYLKQVHFDGQSIIYPKAGSYAITVNLPACQPYQLDIYSGDLLTQLGVGAHGNKIKAWKLKLTSTCAGSLIINKHINNIEGAPHAGIAFELWSNDSLFRTGTTDESGILEFKDLPIGSYVLKELTLTGFTTDLTASQQIEVTAASSALKVVINTPKLKLDTACSADPEATRSWIVTNESNIEVPFIWEVPGSNQTGDGKIPGNTSVTLSTYAVQSHSGTFVKAVSTNPNTLTISWGNEKELSLVNDGEACTTPTPTPSTSPTPTPTITPTPTASATPDTSPTPFSTPETTPTVTPSSTTTPTVSPTPEETDIIEIEDDEPPVGGVDDGQEIDSATDTIVDVNDEQVPLDTLPKTGDTSPIPYYLIGAFALTAGFISIRKQKQSK
ncbi:LPXTG-motif cell wall-anchored protein [Paenibacillus endophyticus]|uniref:LPXTG-motif cell wall-anchored protein n=1 Tax=Paenibacillus endophyticus TaxID=1294268 RepID=A0A7W5CBE2_9BACL|nr:SpaA isopeptide-forming pilin-related protein [Paenibacillus endophyticus]MBB3154621.1 LPXTG-motif cell wall-anchored protein [Paenibacillus endophyticus]